MESPVNGKVSTSLGQECLQDLMRIWFDFERQLGRVPLLQRLAQERFTLEDYRQLLLHLRQQVIEGARWISRGASSFDRDFADVRSMVINHAREEHRDYEMLESDYVAAGGELETIRQGRRNIGSEALAWVYDVSCESEQSGGPDRCHVHHRRPGRQDGQRLGQALCVATGGSEA